MLSHFPPLVYIILHSIPLFYMTYPQPSTIKKPGITLVIPGFFVCSLNFPILLLVALLGKVRPHECFVYLLKT